MTSLLKKLRRKLCIYIAHATEIYIERYVAINNLDVLPITFPNRIGHLIGETDVFIKEIHLGLVKRRKYALINDPAKPFANQEYVRMLRHYFHIINVPRLHPDVAIYIRPSVYASSLWSHLRTYWLDSPARGYAVNSLWGSRPPLLNKEELAQITCHILTSIGWEPDQPFICIHARDAGYSPHDEIHHSPRNVSIDVFNLAVDDLISRGYYVIRMGDASMMPLSTRPGVFDYAVSRYKTEINDLALSSHAHLFLGTASGAYLMASAFGVPVAICNHCLPICYSPTGKACDIGMPKLVRRVSTSELVHFKEIFEAGVSEWRTASDFENSDFELVANTDEEILDLAREALQRRLGEWKDSDEDILLQNSFQALIPATSYSFGTISPCSRTFMRRYAHLILSD
jgi:putative glycosyltransferase (TIGR04372 family)